MSGNELKPYRPQTPALTGNKPTVFHGGPLESIAVRWQAQRDARTMQALAVRDEAATKLNNVHTSLIESETKKNDALVRYHEQPERARHEVELRREQRREEMTTLLHAHQLNGIKRETEITEAMIPLVDAQQQLQARRDHGYLTYELQIRKTQHEILGLEMREEEMRAIMGESRGQKQTQPQQTSDAELNALLYDLREQLNMTGGNTSKIDAFFAKKK